MARKSTMPKGTINGDVRKYLCYREAWSRVKQARQHGFPFEAIAILESIIMDRLSRFLEADGEPPCNGHQSLGNVIRVWKRRYPEPQGQGRFADLRIEIDVWRQARNRAVHGIVRTSSVDPQNRIDDFIEAAELAAGQGALLARALTNWCRNQLRAMKSASPQPQLVPGA